MPFFAIMQGRLVPPEGGRFQAFPCERWRDEFVLAAQARLNAIEWIFDLYGEDANPLISDSGISEILALSQQTGIAVRSLCADYFMDKPFLRTTESERRQLIQKMEWLLSRCKLLGIRRIVIPFVDNSRIEDRGEEAQALSILRTILPAAEINGVELHLETSLGPQAFASLLERCPHPLVRANYDSGNSASLGYRVHEEFAAYGHRIGSIHIKDRLRNPDGSIATKPLGQGSANFDDVFGCMRRINYAGNLTLQVARGESGDEVNWMREQLAFVKRYWQ